LCGGREGEFELGAARASQTQSDETQDTLQVGEQHLDLFTIAARLRVGIGFGKCSRDIARLLRPPNWFYIHIAYPNSPVSRVSDRLNYV
jgi:hypothetical protein